MGDFNLALVIVAVVVSVLVLLVSVYLLVNYQHPDDVNQAYFPKLVVVLGITVAVLSILMLPADVANRQACRRAVYNGACSLTLPMKTLWLVVYIVDAVLVFLVIPFAMFYYEGDQDKSVGKRLKTALIWVVTSAVVCGLILGILYALVGKVDFTVRHLSSSVQPFQITAFSSGQPCISPLARQCSAFTAPASSQTTWTQRATFPEYVVALATIVGSVLFTIFGGVGIACLPLGLIFSFVRRPKAVITRSQYIKEATELGKKAKELKKAAEALHQEERSGNKGRKWRKNVKAVEKELLLLENDMNALEEMYPQGEQAEATWAFTVLAYIGKLIFGVVGLIISIAWVAHIVIYLLIDPPLSSFLNEIFIKLDGVWGLLGTVAFAFFCFYLLIAVIAGEMMLGLKLVFITIHPMKWGGTLMNSFLFNVGLILLCSISAIQFCATAFTYYAQATAAQEIFGHTLHLGSPKRRLLSSSAGTARVTPKRTFRNSDTGKLPRYSPRVVLCAYMIVGHPSVVFNVRGEREKVLVESAANFVKEFELLIKTILDGLDGACILKQSTLDAVSPGSSNYQESSSIVADRKKFRSQLASFDKAWCAYLYHFVVWKAKDGKSLEEDLVTAACKLELSMIQTCKLTIEGQSDNLNNNLKTIQKQVLVDQKLLREKVRHLGGEAGIERMEFALSETRSEFFGAKDNGSPLTTAAANVASPSGQSPLSDIKHNSNMNTERPSRVVQPLIRASFSPSQNNTREKANGGPMSSMVSEKLPTENELVQSLFGASSSPFESNTGDKTLNNPISSTMPEKLPTENEQMVNDILHGSFPDSSDNSGKVEGGFKAKVKETMEKAFWDVVVDSMRGDIPDYSYLINLVKEVRDALHEMAPKGWKEEITNNVNLEVLSQVLESSNQGTQYLGQILQYSLGILRKLSSPAKEDKMKRSHDKLLSELIEHSECNDRGPNSFIMAVIKGLRFTMEELKALQAEVSRARIQLLEPIIKGSGGVEYLQKAFADRYGSPSNASISLPSTAHWISTSRDIVEEEWNEYVSSFSILSATDHVQPFVTTLRAGRGVPDQQRSTILAAECAGLPECTGERLDRLIRIGLLQLISSMEGMQKQSVPETLKLNWLRLRFVQSQFQQVIVIATSMLVQRQVLMSETSNITPSELENITLELFNTLTELLGNFSDVGTDKIIEVMIHSSTSTGSSSDEMIENRKQILTRVFLKSLQTDDTVFKKVSRSVYCAFRAITLGGSGPKGQKLADAALRRIGVTKIADRMVKAAEVLIKVATISEQIHGLWYKHFL